MHLHFPMNSVRETVIKGKVVWYCVVISLKVTIAWSSRWKWCVCVVISLKVVWSFRWRWYDCVVILLKVVRLIAWSFCWRWCDCMVISLKVVWLHGYFAESGVIAWLFRWRWCDHGIIWCVRFTNTQGLSHLKVKDILSIEGSAWKVVLLLQYLQSLCGLAGVNTPLFAVAVRLGRRQHASICSRCAAWQASTHLYLQSLCGLAGVNTPLFASPRTSKNSVLNLGLIWVRFVAS